MKFEKRNFMGIELDVLVGHPEHDLLFVATQVAEAAGLKDGSKQVMRQALMEGSEWMRARDALGDKLSPMKPGDIHAPTWGKMYLFPESTVYQMLLRGHAPASEPFRKWVTEEVLPTIRKTGSYNAADSQDPIAQAIMDELKSLRGEIVSLRQELQAKTFSLEAPVTVVSPYEGQPGIALCDEFSGFNKGTYRELAGEVMPRPAVDRLEARVVLHMEVELGKKWDAEDSRSQGQP